MTKEDKVIKSTYLCVPFKEHPLINNKIDVVLSKKHLLTNVDKIKGYWKQQ